MTNLRHPLGLAMALWVAASAAAEAPRSGANKPPAKERVVCFSEPVVGSHLKKRICMTESEREQRRKADQEAMGALKRPGATNNPKEKM